MPSIVSPTIVTPSAVQNWPAHGACGLLILLLATLALGGCGHARVAPQGAHARTPSLPPVRLSDDGQRFVLADSGEEFVVWGVNYDHDRSGLLLEQYWEEDWDVVEEDFAEMKALGANVVRVHLQVGAFMAAPDRVNEEALDRLARLVELAEEVGLYLDVTGLGCYEKELVPSWYDALGEADRWAVQALFWKSVAGVCADSPAVFCYDLMNEPILPGKDKPETDWLAGEFGGKHFVQRISLDLAGRSREEVAREWINTLVEAIRSEDPDGLITVGVIPWAHVWPNAKPLFYADGVGDELDFVSVHFYPKSGEVEKALAALAVYDIGKPLVIEEMFPLGCSIQELEAFIKSSRDIAEGWVSFYWGKTIEESEAQVPQTIHDAIMSQWLARFRELGPEVTLREVSAGKAGAGGDTGQGARPPHGPEAP